MRSILMVISLLLMLFTGCDYSDNDNATIDWIATHRKPIVCIQGRLSEGFTYQKQYTLVSVDNQFFHTSFTNLILPDTIYAVKIEDIMDSLMTTHSKENGFK